MVNYIHTNLAVNIVVRLPHPQSVWIARAYIIKMLLKMKCK